MNLLKKALLCAAVPLMMGSCQVTLLTTNHKQHGRTYESRLLHKVKNMDDLTFLTDLEMMTYWNIKFRNSVYSSHLGFDSDGDGIINADDIWRYRYGPFVDSNGNGIVDMFDWQIAGFNNEYINNYPYRIHERWLGLDLNPFWFREYTHRHTNYFRIYKRHRHHETKYIRPHVVRDNKRRAIRNTRVRNNINKRKTTTRRMPTTRQNIRSTQIIRTPIKKYIKPIIKRSRIKSIQVKRASIKPTTRRSIIKTSSVKRASIKIIKKSTPRKKIISKRKTTSRRN